MGDPSQVLPKAILVALIISVPPCSIAVPSFTSDILRPTSMINYALYWSSFGAA